MHEITDFHGSRQAHIGSADIPTLLNQNLKWGESWYTLWQEKTGKKNGFEGNSATDWGNYLEPLILGKFCEQEYGIPREIVIKAHMDKQYETEAHGSKLYMHSEAIHPEYQYCIAHADLVVVNGEGHSEIIEAKSTRFMAANMRKHSSFAGYAHPDDDATATGVPLRVRMQEQWQMFCYGIPSSRTAVLVDTSDFRVYGELTASARIQEKLLAIATRFWDFVKADTPPPPGTVDDLMDLFPNVIEEQIQLGMSDAEVVREMKERIKQLSKKEKKIRSEKDDIKKAVLTLAGDKKWVVDSEGNKLVTISKVRKESVSLKKLPEEIQQQLRDGKYINTSEYKTVRWS